MQRSFWGWAFEEETDPRRFSIHRLAHYCLDLAELFDTDRVVPVVIFLRGGPYRRELSLGGDRHHYLQFRYLCCDLSQIPYQRHKESDNLVARLNLPNMRHAPSERVEVYAQAIRGLLQLEPHPEKQLKYLDFIDIYTALDENEQQRYRLEYPEEVQKMTRFAERFVQQGMQQGEAAVLLRQLRRRFGDLPPEQRRRIETADAETLLNWADRVLTAQNLDEVLH